MWREVLRIINGATVEGLAQAKEPPSHEADFYTALRHSNEVFAAFKVHSMGEKMAARLLDSDGKLKPFRQWADEVKPISSHHVGAWLRTEYDTALIRAHNAADWRQFERDKDIMPNLRWMPTTSPAPEGSHRAFWERRLTLPVGHPFWNKHHPGDRWNCKCSLEATDEPATPELIDGLDGEKPQRGLENNPGKDGHTFNDTHPYFPKSCAKCRFYRKANLKNRLLGGFANRKKDCFNCPYIDSRIDKAKQAAAEPPAVETYTKLHNGMVLASPYHGENELADNVRLAKFVADKLNEKVYLLPRLDPNNPVQKKLRDTLLPPGVKENKNPDFLIKGKLFDGKSMYGMNRNATEEQQRNAIENHIKKAKKQADNIILEIPSIVRRELIHYTVKKYLSRSKRDRIIMVRWKNKLLIYGGRRE